MEVIDPRPLFDRLSSGDGQAISTLVASHLPGLRSFIAGYAPTKALAGHVLQRTWLRFAATFDAASLADPATRLHSLAKEELLTCLDEQVRRCMQGQDALGYGVVSRAVDRLKSHDNGADDPVPATRDRVAQLDDSQRDLLTRRYRDRLALEALARVAKTSDQAVAAALFCVRAGLADLGETAAALSAHDRLFPTLIEDYLEGALSADARGMLARTIASNLDHLGLFEVQVRLDLILDAALGGEGTLVTVITEAVRATLLGRRSPRVDAFRLGEAPSRQISDRQTTARSGGVSRQVTARTTAIGGGNGWTWIGLAMVGLAALLGLGVLVSGTSTPMKPVQPTVTAPIPGPEPTRSDPPPAPRIPLPPRATPVVAPPDPPITVVPVATAPRPPTVIGTPPSQGTPGVRRQLWRDLGAAGIDAFILQQTFPDAPGDSSILPGLTVAADLTSTQVVRLTALLVPPVTGTYRLVLICGSPGELWLSNDDGAQGKRRCAWVPDFTGPRDRFKHPSQTSPPIALAAGKRHLIEVLVVGGATGSHLTVGWLMPDGQEQIPIANQHLIVPEPAVAWVRGDSSLPPHDQSAALVVAPVTVPPLPPIAAPIPPAVADPTAPTAVPSNFVLPPAASTGVRRGVWTLSKPIPLAVFFAKEQNSLTNLQISTEPALASPPAIPAPFASRLTAFLVPPISGNYRFAVTSSEQSEVWLSPTTTFQGKRLVASVPSPSPAGNFDRFPSQRSVAIPLAAGRRYCIEVVHCGTDANNHLTVGWTLPTGDEQAPIPGRHLVLPKVTIPWVKGDPTLPIAFPSVTAAATVTAVPAVATGAPGDGTALRPGLRRERWNNIPGADLTALIRHPTYPGTPDELAFESAAQSTAQGEHFGERLIGWLVPPESGDYVFDLRGDDYGQFWLGVDDQPASRQLLVSSRLSLNRSKPIALEAGRRYWFEVLHHQHTLEVLCVVGWTLPSGQRQAPIPGAHLLGRDPAAALASKLRPGFLRRERWNGIPGQMVDDLLQHAKFAQPPDQVTFEPVARSLAKGEQFGERLVGWLLPPVTGDYHLDFDSDDDAEIWLGLDDRPVSRQRVVGPGHNKQSTRTPVRLEAGRRYYFEILHKEHDGETYCFVGWTLPSGERQMPIPGSALATVDRESAVASAAPSRPGFLRRERWKGLTGENVDALRTHPRFPTQPDEVAFEPAAESRAQGDNFGERLVGWLIPPSTGDYRFDLNSDDDGELWLSTDDRPVGLRKVAFDNVPRNVELFLPVIPLVAGRRYYVEIMHMQGGGSTYCTVGWTLPNGERQFPIPGAHLATSDRDAVTPRPPGSDVLLVDKPQLRIERLPMPERTHLPDIGRLDWALWGQVGGNPLQVTRKAGVPALVQVELTGGATEAIRHKEYPMPFSWTDGEREQRGDDRRGAINTDGPGRGFLLTFPADRQVRDVRLFVGGWNASYRLDAGLEGHPPQAPDLVPMEAGDRGYYYLIRYAAGVDGRKLRVRWIATSTGHAWLAAAAVNPAAP